MADEQAELDQLPVAEQRPELGPQRVRQGAVGVKLVGRPQQERLTVGPSGGLGSVADGGDPLGFEPGGGAEPLVVAPLVFGAACCARPGG